jgi:hypothetical protein
MLCDLHVGLSLEPSGVLEARPDTRARHHHSLAHTSSVAVYDKAALHSYRVRHMSCSCSPLRINSECAIEFCHKTAADMFYVRRAMTSGCPHYDQNHISVAFLRLVEVTLSRSLRVLAFLADVLDLPTAHIVRK